MGFQNLQKLIWGYYNAGLQNVDCKMSENVKIKSMNMQKILTLLMVDTDDVLNKIDDIQVSSIAGKVMMLQDLKKM